MVLYWDIVESMFFLKIVVTALIGSMLGAEALAVLRLTWPILVLSAVYVPIYKELMTGLVNPHTAELTDVLTKDMVKDSALSREKIDVEAWIDILKANMPLENFVANLNKYDS